MKEVSIYSISNMKQIVQQYLAMASPIDTQGRFIAVWGPGG